MAARRGERRVLIGGISHETNTFSVEPTDLAQFYGRVLISGSDLLIGFGGTRTTVGGFLEGLALLGATPVPLLYASATPGGIVTRAAYLTLRSQLLDGVRAALPVTGMLLALHGAMVAEGVPDAEGALLQAIRALVGPDVPVIATLDSHANVSPLMVAAATALIGYTTYPHVDTHERGREAADLLTRILLHHVRPTASLATPPMLVPLPPQSTQSVHGSATPMHVLLARARALCADPRVLNVTVTGGFPYSDVPEAGLRVLVTTADDAAFAREAATILAREAWAMRAQFQPRMVSIADAITQIDSAPRFPLVLADSGDNPGAGAPCDGTALLHARYVADVRGVAVAVIADAETVAQAVAAGTGATLAVRLGGKRDTRGGPPLVAPARVIRITDGVFTNTGPMGTGSRTRMGRTVVLALGGTGRTSGTSRADAATNGVHVIVTEQRTQALDLSLFRSAGIEPTAMRALVVKSSVHFRAAFAPIAAAILDVDTPGISNPNLHLHLAQFPFQHIRRPIWPLDPETTYDV